MKRLYYRLRYRLERLILRSTLTQLLVATVVLALMMVLGGLAAFSLTDQFDHLHGALWWALLRLSDPGYLGEDVGRAGRAISLMLTLFGVVFFTGAVVAILTNRLAALLDEFASGHHRIVESGHVLIVGWPPGTAEIVEHAVRAQRRLADERRASPSAVVILVHVDAPVSLGELESKLRARLPAELDKTVPLLIRTGDPTELESLQRVDAANASAIILLPSSLAAAPRRSSDLQLIETLAALEGIDSQPERTPPTVTLDLSVASNRPLAESVGPERKRIITHADFLSSMLAQSIRRPGFAQVARQFSDRDSAPLAACRADELGVQGHTLRDILPALSTTIPLGYFRPGADQARWEEDLRLLAWDEPLRDADWIVCLASSSSDITRGYAPDRLARSSDPAPRQASATMPPARQARRVLIIGRSYILRALSAHLSSHRNEHFEVTLVHWEEVEVVRAYMSQLGEHFPNVAMNSHLSRLNSLDEVAQSRPERYDTILLLVPEFPTDPQLPDADTVTTSYLIDHHLQAVCPNHRIEVITELYAPHRLALLPPRFAARALTLPSLISRIAIEAALAPAAAAVYEQLLTAGGPEIMLPPLVDALGLGPGERVDFDRCQQACMASDEVALGYLLEGPRDSFEAGVHLNPKRTESFLPEPDDKLVVVRLEH